MTRSALFFLAILGLSACDPATGAVVAGGSLVSLVHSDKLPSDHALDWATEKDCSVLHAARNQPYCQPPAASLARQQMARQAASLYCYRTLGGVSCYDRPDYSAGSQTRIDFAHGYAPAPGTTPAPAAPAVADLSLPGQY